MSPAATAFVSLVVKPTDAGAAFFLRVAFLRGGIRLLLKLPAISSQLSAFSEGADSCQLLFPNRLQGDPEAPAVMARPPGARHLEHELRQVPPLPRSSHAERVQEIFGRAVVPV